MKRVGERGRDAHLFLLCFGYLVCSPLASFRTSAHSSEHGCSPPPSTLRPARGGLLARDRCALDRGARWLPQRVRLRLQHAGSRGVDWRLGAMRAGRPEERGAANRTLRYRSRRGPRLEEVALLLLAPRGAGDQVAFPAFPQCVKFSQVMARYTRDPRIIARGFPLSSRRYESPGRQKIAWLPVGVNYNKPARGSVSLI